MHASQLTRRVPNVVLARARDDRWPPKTGLPDVFTGEQLLRIG